MHDQLHRWKLNFNRLVRLGFKEPEPSLQLGALTAMSKKWVASEFYIYISFVVFLGFDKLLWVGGAGASEPPPSSWAWSTPSWWKLQVAKEEAPWREEGGGSGGDEAYEDQPEEENLEEGDQEEGREWSKEEGGAARGGPRPPQGPPPEGAGRGYQRTPSQAARRAKRMRDRNRIRWRAKQLNGRYSCNLTATDQQVWRTRANLVEGPPPEVEQAPSGGEAKGEDEEAQAPPEAEKPGESAWFEELMAEEDPAAGGTGGAGEVEGTLAARISHAVEGLAERAVLSRLTALSSQLEQRGF